MKKRKQSRRSDSWIRAQLGQCGDLYCGQSASVAEVNTDGRGQPYFTGPEQWDGQKLHVDKWTEHPKRLVPDGCIFITVKGAGVGTMFPGMTGAIGRDIYAFHVHKELDYHYVFYALKFTIEQIIRKAQGDIPGLSKTHILDHEIGLPGIDQQRRIVTKIEELFSELDNGIESLTTAREQLKVYRLALLKHAFEGKLTADWRQDNKASDQLLAGISREREAHHAQEVKAWQAAVKAWEVNGQPGRKPSKPRQPRPIQPCADDKLPILPSGWLWLRYGDLCSLIRNGISQKPEGASGTKIFRISAVRPMEFILDDFRYIDNSGGQYDNYYLRTSDLVFTRYNGSRAYVGVCAKYESDGTHLFPDKLIQTRLAITSMLPGYVERAVNCGESRRYIERLIRTTAGQSGISGSDIRAIPIPVCGSAEQEAITERLDGDMSRIAQLLSEIETSLMQSEALRQSILKKAFSGQLVAQDPTDEPASVLLERIMAEKDAGESTNGRRRRKEAA